MVIGLLLASSAFMIAIDPARAPFVLIVLLLVSARPLFDAWRAVRGTALRPALVWAFLALALAVIAQTAALTEPLSQGRPLAERFNYLSVLALLAALGSVLNARTPGGKAWACLMVVLVVVFLIPWLEDRNIYSRGRFGMWKYEVSNTDHTLMQGVELANRLMLDEPETTIGMKYASTLDGRNAASHERAHVAGSGDPKKTTLAIDPGDRKNEPHVSEEELGVTITDQSKEKE